MKLTNNEWQTLCRILENRSYRYSDIDDTTSKDYNLFTNISKRINASVEGSTQRFNAEQKDYLIAMLEEYRLCAVEDIDSNKKYALHTKEEIEDIDSMMYKLTGNKPFDMCDLMCN